MREIRRTVNPKPCHMKKKVQNIGNVEPGRERALRGNVIDFFKFFKDSVEETLDLFRLDCRVEVTGDSNQLIKD